MSLAAVREKKDQAEHEKSHALHEDGKLFKFEPFEYSDVAPLGVGMITGELPICVVLNKDLSGICMSRDSARRLGEALIECAEDEIIHEEYEPEPPPKAG